MLTLASYIKADKHICHIIMFLVLERVKKIPKKPSKLFKDYLCKYTTQTASICGKVQSLTDLHVRIKPNVHVILLPEQNTHINQRQEAVVFYILSQNLSDRLISKLDTRRRRRGSNDFPRLNVDCTVLMQVTLQ